MSDMRTLTLGQVVDYVMAYNERQERAERASKGKEKSTRRATQADIDAFFG